MERRKADFVIAGFQKCGTTSLAWNLPLHPDIHCEEKELHLFDKRGNMAKKIRFWEKRWGMLPHKRIGEKTPVYAHVLPTIKRMKLYWPDVKIILIMRDPVERVVSHYYYRSHNRKRFSTNPSHQKYISFEQFTNVKNGPFDRGKYVNKIKNILKHYDEEQILFLVFEKFKKDPQNTYTRIFNFLDVEPKEIIHTTHGKTLRKHSHVIDPVSLKKVKRNYQPFNDQLFDLLGYEIKEWNQ